MNREVARSLDDGVAFVTAVLNDDFDAADEMVTTMTDRERTALLYALGVLLARCLPALQMTPRELVDQTTTRPPAPGQPTTPG